MAKNTNIQSVEPNIADLVNGWLKAYKLDYKLEQESLNTEIDQALNDYFSKNGGKGGNRPDAKLLLRANNGKYYPILIEYKGYKDKLVKLDSDGNIANKNAQNQPDFTNINSYAVNGAVHYAYGADDHIAVVHTENLPKDAAIFVTSAIHKASHNGQYHYGNNFYAKDADILNIQLPVTNGEPDYDKMAILISAIHKMVIKDVILYSDQKIAATQTVVSPKSVE